MVPIEIANVRYSPHGRLFTECANEEEEILTILKIGELKVGPLQE
jgi:hypothetical protein